MLSGNIPSFYNSSSFDNDSSDAWLDYSMGHLDLSRNSLTGNLPQSLFHFSQLVTLKVGNNNLGGEIPDIFGSCALLQWLSLHDNNFHGKLPASLQNCTNLLVLDLGWNHLSGSLPQYLNRLAPTLQVFMIGSNDFDGVLPLWLSNFTSLQVLDFSGNRFSGPIPPSLNRLKGLLQPGQHLSNGTLYAEIQIVAKNQALDFSYVLAVTTSLDLSHNQLDGDIPTELSDLQGLLFLNFSHNHLRGAIQPGLANLTALESLDLSNNQLSGKIPPELAVGLTFLTSLNLSDNLLSGPIPSSNQFRTFSAASYGSNLGLCGPPVSDSCSSPAPAPTSSSHEPFVEEWFSLEAFGVGVAIGFTLFSSFLLPWAYVSGREAIQLRAVLARRRPYGFFMPEQ